MCIANLDGWLSSHLLAQAVIQRAAHGNEAFICTALLKAEFPALEMAHSDAAAGRDLKSDPSTQNSCVSNHKEAP